MSFSFSFSMLGSLILGQLLVAGTSHSSLLVTPGDLLLPDQHSPFLTSSGCTTQCNERGLEEGRQEKYTKHQPVRCM